MSDEINQEQRVGDWALAREQIRDAERRGRSEGFRAGVAAALDIVLRCPEPGEKREHPAVWGTRHMIAGQIQRELLSAADVGALAAERGGGIVARGSANDFHDQISAAVAWSKKREGMRRAEEGEEGDAGSASE